jgi:hypothetical protein
LNGRLDSLGGDEDCDVWFEWGTSSGAYLYDTDSSIMGVTGLFNFDLKEKLDPDTTYYFRAAAKNDIGFGYGLEESFHTLPDVEQYTLIILAKPSEGGWTTPEVGNHKYDIDEVVEITAEAYEKYEFSHWEGDVLDRESPVTTVTMDDDKYVIAYFQMTESYRLSADFTWFDVDGLNPGKEIRFNADNSFSECSSIKNFKWYLNEDGVFNRIEGIDIVTSIFTYTFENNGDYEVMLEVTDECDNSDVCIYTVQVNKIQTPETDSSEENNVDLTNENNDEIFDQDDEKYFTDYTQEGDLLGTNFYLYEIKNKKSADYKILDINSINNLESLLDENYNEIKSRIGLGDIYNFNIIIKDGNDNIICSCGATKDDSYFQPLKTVKRKVLIYYPPDAIIPAGKEVARIDNHPIYEEGEVLVSIFLGGEIPS